MGNLDDTNVHQRYAQIFSALGEPIRLEIIRRIAGTDELPCTALDEALTISKSTISYHIKILYRAQLIAVRKDGRYYFYRLRRDVFDQLLPAFLDRVEPDAVNAVGS